MLMKDSTTKEWDTSNTAFIRDITFLEVDLKIRVSPKARLW